MNPKDANVIGQRIAHIEWENRPLKAGEQPEAVLHWIVLDNGVRIVVTGCETDDTPEVLFAVAQGPVPKEVAAREKPADELVAAVRDVHAMLDEDGDLVCSMMDAIFRKREWRKRWSALRAELAKHDAAKESSGG